MTTDMQRRVVPIETPTGRELQVYAFDPSLSTQMDTSLINHATLTVPWENELAPGPVGEYIVLSGGHLPQPNGRDTSLYFQLTIDGEGA
jgi:hypothetical protein